MKINELLTEAPIDFDPSEPMNPLIHSHQGANPGKLQYRMARAAGQLKDLAARAEICPTIPSRDHVLVIN